MVAQYSRSLRAPSSKLSSTKYFFWYPSCTRIAHRLKHCCLVNIWLKEPVLPMLYHEADNSYLVVRADSNTR